MIRDSFSLNPKLLDDFKACIPVNKSRKMLRSYLLNEYQLPENLSSLEQEVKNPVIQPYWMTDAEINKLSRLVKEAEKNGSSISRSAIIRDVLNDLVIKYKNEPVLKSEQHRQRFQIPYGTKKRLSNLIDNRDLTYELSTFILEDYTPSGVFDQLGEKESFNYKTDIEIFHKLDEISIEYDLKKGGRSKVFRDALSQFEKSLQISSPKKESLKRELESIIKEYKNIEDVKIIKEEIEKYLDK